MKPNCCATPFAPVRSLGRSAAVACLLIDPATLTPPCLQLLEYTTQVGRNLQIERILNRSPASSRENEPGLCCLSKLLRLKKCMARPLA